MCFCVKCTQISGNFSLLLSIVGFMVGNFVLPPKMIIEPAHEIMALFVLRAHPSNGARYLVFCWTLRLLPFFMCANSEGSGKTVLMRRLT